MAIIVLQSIGLKDIMGWIVLLFIRELFILASYDSVFTDNNSIKEVYSKNDKVHAGDRQIDEIFIAEKREIIYIWNKIKEKKLLEIIW